MILKENRIWHIIRLGNFRVRNIFIRIYSWYISLSLKYMTTAKLLSLPPNQGESDLEGRRSEGLKQIFEHINV